MNDLHDLLHDAVDGIEPHDRLAELRARTADSSRAAARPWFVAAGGDGARHRCGRRGRRRARTGRRTRAGAPPPRVDPPDPAPWCRRTSWPTARRAAGSTASSTGCRPATTCRAPWTGSCEPPADPDYQTTWPAGTLTTATLGDGTIDVGVSDEPLVYGADDLPVQQVVYTLQGTLGERLPCASCATARSCSGRSRRRPSRRSSTR